MLTELQYESCESRTTVETANRRNRFHHAKTNHCLLTLQMHTSSIYRIAVRAVTALTRECVQVFTLTDHLAVRWFKAFPSGRFGAVALTALQSVVESQIIVVARAREVIPQPTPQPNQSMETRRRWQPRG